MHNVLRLTAVVLAVASLSACGGDGGGDAQRLAALGSRLDAVEKRVGASAASSDTIETLRNDTASLDRRLTSLETSVRELAARPAPVATPPPAATGAHPNAGRPPAGGPAAWGDAPTTRPDRTERRAELRTLSDEFRQKLADLRTQPGGMEPGSDQTREILDWYRDQRRSILRGDGRTDQPKAQ
jgi:hypothetical protein